MEPREFAQQVKARYPQYESMNDFDLARKVLKRYPEYMNTVDPRKLRGVGGFIREAAGDVRGAISGIKEAGKQFGQDFKSITERTASGEQSPLRSAAQTVGLGLGTGAKIAGSVAEGALGVAAPQSVEEFTKKQIGKVAEPIINSKFIQENKEALEFLEQNDPAKAADVRAAMGTIEAILEFAGGGSTKSVARKALGTTGDIAQTGVKTVSPVARTVSDAAEFGIAQSTGMSPTTLKTLVTRPVEFRKAVDAGVERSTISTQLFDKVSKNIEDFSETGAQYKPIREAATPVNITPDFIEGAIKSAGFDVDKTGRIVATTKSPTRNTADINALQKLLNDWGGVSQATSDEFLNLRSDLSELAKFDKISGKTKTSETVSKGIRKELNKNFRDQVPGLKELDTKFETQVNDLKEIRKKFFNNDGTIKDDTANKLFRAANKDTKVIKDLKKIDPEIEDKIRIVRAIEDINYSSGQKAGSYFRTALSTAGTGALLISGNVPLAVLSLMVTSPKISSQIITWLASRNLITGPTANSVVDAISAGKKITKRQGDLFTDALSKMTESDLAELVSALPDVAAVSQVSEQLSSEEQI